LLSTTYSYLIVLKTVILPSYWRYTRGGMYSLRALVLVQVAVETTYRVLLEYPFWSQIALARRASQSLVPRPNFQIKYHTLHGKRDHFFLIIFLSCFRLATKNESQPDRLQRLFRNERARYGPYGNLLVVGIFH
jgi:hypothetical protein